MAGAVLLVGDGSPGWSAARVVVWVALVVVEGVAWRRSSAGAAVAVVLGVVLVAVGAGFVLHVGAGAPVVGAASLTAIVTGLGLAGLGVVDLVRRRSWPVRALGAIGASTFVVVTTMVVAPAVMATNVRPVPLGSSPSTVGLAYEDVSLRTADGVDLAGWYVAPVDGAAVVLRHGAGSTRSDVLDEAAVLARRGYGVLMVDARGHGDSDGRAMDFGWWGDADVAASVSWLAARPEVDADRIGLVGLSMGGEEVIGAAPAVAGIRAVVAEGATARVAEDKAWLSDRYGVRGIVQERIEAIQYGLTDLLTSASPPTPLRGAVAEADGTSFLLITGGAVPDERVAADHIAAGARERVQVWTVPGAGHTDGLATAPSEWESTVVGFLDAHL